MSDPYVGEIRMFGGNFDPLGWMLCDGRLLPIANYTTLFSLIGTIYGGDGATTFALPDFRARVPVHQGQGFTLSNYTVGAFGGSETVTLTQQHMPLHTHSVVVAKDAGHLSEPGGALPAPHRDYPVFDSASDMTFSPNAIAAAGASMPHWNMPPYLCITFVICVTGGYFPPR
jgi:microcystin-dependent protein